MLAIVRIALRRPYTFVVMAILMLIFGGMAWLKTPTDVFPDIGIPVISVVWTYNGLPPDDMSGRIIYYYERTLSAQVNDIEHIESQSLPGLGVVKVFFQPKVNISAALAQVTAASQTVLKFLPPGITPPYVLTFNASSVPILQLALSSKTLTETQLFDFGQNFIRQQLATVAGAAIPSPYGGRVREVQVDLDQNRLIAQSLSAQDVVDAIAKQNLITPVGTEKIGLLEYIVSLNVAPSDIAKLNDLPIKKIGEAIIYVRDVAYVHDGSPPQINVVRVDGGSAVLMTIQKSGSASTLDVIEGVKSLLPKIKASLPKEIELTALGDQSVFVHASVSGVIFEGAVAAALTGLMILVFLGSWRSTLIITISIPLAILSSIALLAAFGETINVMTLGGLALAVGVLVDDATVTIENVSWHLEQGKDIEDAIIDGARQIVVPATVSLLCITIAFVPMFGLGGVAGFLFRPLAEAVVFALFSSYLLSRTLVATLARYLLQPHRHEPEVSDLARKRNPFLAFQRNFERRFEVFRAAYRFSLELALAVPRLFVLGFIFAVAASLSLAPVLGRNFFPLVESPQIKLHLRAPIGTRIEETTRLCNRIETAIRSEIPTGAIESVVDNIGLPISGINMAYANSGAIGMGDADLLITLKSEEAKHAESYVETLRENLPRLFPGTTFAFLPADMVTQILNFGLPAPIDIQIIGNQLAENRAYANEIYKRVARVGGVADARIQQAFNAPTLNIDVDRSFAMDVGITEKDVASSMQDTLAGSIQNAPTFWLNPKNGVSYPIVAQAPQYSLSSLSDLQNLPITSSNASQMLAALATVSRGVRSAVISHYNVQPVLDIFASNSQRDLGAVAGDIQSILDDMYKYTPKGSTVVLSGQVKTMQSAYSQLLIGLLLAIVLIFLVIVVNFQSWLDPLIIVCALPAALAGITWMLFLTNTTLSVPALTGAIMTMGIATANSILVISFAREQLAEGMNAMEAAIAAGFTRFRPVLMTALAMIIGMAPMALSAEQNAPLGRAVIGGLLCATLATLYFVPVVFSLIHASITDSHQDSASISGAQ